MKPERSCGLPTALIRYLADAHLHVLSWDGPTGVLLVKVTKDIGPETGLITFTGVSHVNLPPQLEIAGIDCGPLDDLPATYLGTYRPGDKSLDPEDAVYLVHGSWGEEFFVIANKVEYVIAP